MSDGELIPPEDLKNDPSLKVEIAGLRKTFTPKVQQEVLALVCGQHMNKSRAQAVKRVVRRIRQLMGDDAPSAKTLKWWVAEMLGELESCGGMVKLGILRTIAEAVGLLAPGGGLVSKASKGSMIPRNITFSTVPQKPKVLGSGKAQLAKLELKETVTTKTVTLSQNETESPSTVHVTDKNVSP